MENDYNVEQMPPVEPLRTDRGLAKYYFLSLITLGIYGLVVNCHIGNEINQIASQHDGKNTMHFALIAFIFSWLTLGIVPLVWYHRICDRIGNELYRRNINYEFDSLTFWGWNILGSFILVGPFIFIHKWMKAMNLLNADYNERG